MISDPRNTLIVITGPTAVGKTSLTIHLARSLGTEIISADSRQFYREMSIGTARPSEEELKSAPHHFIGQLSIQDDYNVSRFEADVLKLLEELFKKHKCVIMAGGSGLYINAVCHGIDDLPDPDDSLREELKILYASEGIGTLRAKLKILDPDYYQQADLANPKRLLRALEVCITTGKPYSSLRTNVQKERDFRIIKIGLAREREELYNRINRRVDEMVNAGLVAEAEQLLPYRNLNALNTVGYMELFPYFDRMISLESAIENIKTHSRRFAKRQMTWLRRDAAIRWFHPDKVDEILNFGKEISL
ncbi:MAG: tRNA (adenosine(37)-N6)-dimethylallyltransferase MiaA [Bacteroidetes bacterium]|nr:tRNA (adenosine(37)-N6)-dimethylallyltransferase MiaA [Bacteroidota bacterium]